MATRFFTLNEAQQMLPALETLLGSALDHKKKLEELETALGGIRQRVMAAGGLLPDFEELGRLKSGKDGCIAKLRDAVADIHNIGCVVKDLDVGLVDFPCLMDDREVYLCWKLGEPAIRFWHNTDEGFANRKPIGEQWAAGGDSRPN